MKEIPSNGDLLNPGERWATPEEMQEFWTEERLEIAKNVYEQMNWRLMEEFGGPEALPFHPKVFLLAATDEKKETVFLGSHHRRSGWITLNIHSIKENDRLLGEVIAHEVGESRAERFSIDRPEFAFIDESVIEITLQRFLYDAWPQLKDDPDPVAYSRVRKATDIMCKQIFHTQPEHFTHPHKVLEFLQRAIFKDQTEDFIDVFTKTYGEKGLPIMQALGNFGSTVSNVDLVDTRNGNEVRYHWLLKFLGGEDIKLWEALEAITQQISRAEERELIQAKNREKERIEHEKTHAPREEVKDGEGKVIKERFWVNNKTFEIDYRSVPEDVPVEDMAEEKSYARYGVKARVGQVINKIHSDLNGKYTHVNSMYVGELPGATDRYSPDESYLMRCKIENTAHQLLAQALGVEEQPSYELLTARKSHKRKAEFHEATFLGELEDGKKVYFVHLYNTRKVRNKLEWDVLRDHAQVHVLIMTPEKVEEWVAERRLWYK